MATSKTGQSEATIALEVFRYRPEEEDEPTFQLYDVPYREDWVVLDALNHVKDRIDGTLSYRWSCRMGVCGSCGMMVASDCPILLAAIDTISGRPTGDDYVQIFNARIAVCLKSERMFEEPIVVALCVIGALV